jgi:hypothetical protein
MTVRIALRRLMLGALWVTLTAFAFLLLDLYT